VAIFLISGLLFSPRARQIRVGNVLLPPERLIIYLFIGHSNMTGYCGAMDTVSHPRAWVFDDTTFRPARDPITGSKRAGSPVMPFLKAMAARYPDYYFCAVKVTQPGKMMTETFFPGASQYGELVSTMDRLAGHAVAGGALAMFGYVEGISDSLSGRFGADAAWLIHHLRGRLNAPALPFVFGRYEEHASTTGSYTHYLRYAERIRLAIETLPTLDTAGLTALTPRAPIPPEHYCDDHHYDPRGYHQWSRTAAEIIAARGWDGWCDRTPDSLSPRQPHGLTLTRLHPTSATPAWLPAGDNVFVTSYEVTVQADSTTSPRIRVVDAQDTCLHLGDLEPATRYTVRVRAIDKAANRSPLSEPLRFRTPAGCENGGRLWLTAPAAHLVVGFDDTITIACAWDSCTMPPQSPALFRSAGPSGPWVRLPPAPWRYGKRSCVMAVGLGKIAETGTYYFQVRDAALELRSEPAGPVYLEGPHRVLALLSPEPGDTYALDDTVRFRWSSSFSPLTAPTLSLSRDSGKTWTGLTGDDLLCPNDSSCAWVPADAPLALGGSSLLFKLQDYDSDIQAITGPVKITGTTAAGSVVNTTHRAWHIRRTSEGLLVSFPPKPEGAIVSVRTLGGRLLYRSRIPPSHAAGRMIPVRRWSGGVVVVTVEGATGGCRRYVVGVR
jgi:hypothetical protein